MTVLTAGRRVRARAEDKKGPGSKGRPVQRTTRILYYIALCVLAIYSLGPLVIFIFTALKSETELAQNPLGFPHHLAWSNFQQAWDQGHLATGLVNSAVITIGTVLGVCVIAGCAAHAMARLDLPGSGLVIVYLLGTTALPIQLFLVPLFFLWSHLGLYNNLFGIIVIYWAIFSPFATLLLRSFMLSIPRDYEDAARLDGAGELSVLRRVTLPLAAPGFVTIALVSGLAAWNEFLLAVTFLQSTDKQPISIALYSFQQGFTQNYALISAAGVVMLLPMVLFFLLLQRRFVAGLTAGGLGG
jgi:raffinose/stachyose/melibiose transport system permease protein